MAEHVAGTILHIDETGRPLFMLKRDKKAGAVLYTTLEKEGMTPLAAMLQGLREDLLLDISELRLVELSNLTVDNQNLSLFVFQWADKATDHFQKRADGLEKAGFTFEAPGDFADLLGKVTISGVPHIKSQG